MFHERRQAPPNASSSERYASSLPMDQGACSHAATCGGCPLIERSPADQLAHKRARVLRAVGRFPALVGLEVRVVEPADPVFGYRARAKLVVGPGARIGLFAREGDHVVVDIPGCRVLSPALAEVALCLRQLLSAGALPSLQLSAVDLREALGPDDRSRVLVTLVLERGREPPAEADLATWAARIQSGAPAVASVATSFRERGSVQVLGRDLIVLAGAESVPDRIGPPRDGAPAPWVAAVHGGFVQVHRGQGARLRAWVADGLCLALGGLAGRHVVDAYAGSGATGIALAGRGARVTLVEAHRPSAEHARRAALEQGLPVEVVAGDAADVLGTLGAVDAIVLNPPRRGVAPAVRRAVAASSARAIAVVSCEPETLARDLDHLARLGWAAAALAPLDMLPQTEEVETVAILVPGPARDVTVLHEERDLVAVAKPAYEPVFPDREETNALALRVRARRGLPRAEPLQRLDAGTSGVCLFATSPEAAVGWATALAAPDAEAEIVALVRGIVRERGVVTVRNARAHLRRTRVVNGHSLVSVRLPVARIEPLRRALAMMGHAVLGDERHGHASSNRHWLERHGLDRPFFHCARVSLRHPRSGETFTVLAELPGELTAVLGG